MLIASAVDAKPILIALHLFRRPVWIRALGLLVIVVPAFVILFLVLAVSGVEGHGIASFQCGTFAAWLVRVCLVATLLLEPPVGAPSVHVGSQADQFRECFWLVVVGHSFLDFVLQAAIVQLSKRVVGVFFSDIRYFLEFGYIVKY